MPPVTLLGKRKLGTIVRAATQSRTITIDYMDSNGILTTGRVVQPYEIKKGGIYAYDVNKANIRFCKLSGIKRVVMNKGGFTPLWPIKIEPEVKFYETIN